jgi:hypothetical protein
MAISALSRTRKNEDLNKGGKQKEFDAKEQLAEMVSAGIG